MIVERVQLVSGKDSGKCSAEEAGIVNRAAELVTTM